MALGLKRFGWLPPVLLVALFASPSALAAGDPVRGNALLVERGCAGCHSYDGAVRQGPTYAGLVGKTRRVMTQEKLREVVADEAYIQRSILEPNADILEGYVPGAMPGLPVTPKDAADLAAAIMEIGKPKEPPKTGTLLALALAMGLFVFGHLGLSSLAVRRPLIAKWGEKGFQGAYSLFAAGAMGWMVHAFRNAPYVELWALPAGARDVPLVVMPLVFLLMVCGFSTKNPTSAGQEGTIQIEPKGIVRITRHPVLWSFALWGLSHLPPNGDARSVILFGGIAFLAFAGMLHIDSRRKVALGDAWEAFASKTSVLPFARSGAGAAFKEIGIVRLLVAIVLYVGVLHSHRLLIGVSAMP